jgi:hypothetical protein
MAAPSAAFSSSALTVPRYCSSFLTVENAPARSLAAVGLFLALDNVKGRDNACCGAWAPARASSSRAPLVPGTRRLTSHFTSARKKPLN